MSKKPAEARTYNTATGLRWNVKNLQNGKKLANGGQGYSRRIDMEHAMRETADAIARYFADKRG